LDYFDYTYIHDFFQYYYLFHWSPIHCIPLHYLFLLHNPHFLGLHFLLLNNIHIILSKDLLRNLRLTRVINNLLLHRIKSVVATKYYFILYFSTNKIDFLLQNILLHFHNILRYFLQTLIPFTKNYFYLSLYYFQPLYLDHHLTIFLYCIYNSFNLYPIIIEHPFYDGHPHCHQQINQNYFLA
jgi:hypothetical protein